MGKCHPVALVYCIFIFLLQGISICHGQNVSTAVKRDSSWIKSYDTSITGRLYFSQKYLSMIISEGKDAAKLKYRPNSNLAIGLGASYGWFTLNIAYAFGFLNPGDAAKGKSTNLDLQTHFYGTKTIIGFFGQYYKGFYLYPQGTATTGNWYVRPDINLWNTGLAGYYVVNWRKFSSRASLIQSEWQVKSAGSILLGVEIAYGQSHGDSAFVPSVLADGYKSGDINGTRHIAIGPGMGYAYTLVVDRNWFATAALTCNLSVNWFQESLENKSSSRFSVRPNLSYKAGIGYNRKNFTGSITWVNSTALSRGTLTNYDILAGNVRMHFAYRMNASKKFKKTFRFFQKPLF